MKAKQAGSTVGLTVPVYVSGRGYAKLLSMALDEPVDSWRDGVQCALCTIHGSWA